MSKVILPPHRSIYALDGLLKRGIESHVMFLTSRLDVDDEFNRPLSHLRASFSINVLSEETSIAALRIPTMTEECNGYLTSNDTGVSIAPHRLHQNDTISINMCQNLSLPLYKEEHLPTLRAAIDL